MTTEPKIEIAERIGCYEAYVYLSDGHQTGVYLHTDLVWRRNAVGPKGYTGYWPTLADAKLGYIRWLTNQPKYDRRITKDGERSVRVRK